MGLTTERPGLYSVSMAVLLHWNETHTPATTRGVGRRVNLRSSSTVQRWLDSAWRAGLIEKRGGRYYPRESCVCSSCGASHVSGRETA